MVRTSIGSLAIVVRVVDGPPLVASSTTQSKKKKKINEMINAFEAKLILYPLMIIRLLVIIPVVASNRSRRIRRRYV